MADWIIDGQPGMDLWDVDIRRFLPFQCNKSYLRERTTETLGLLYAMHWPFRQNATARGARRSILHERLAAQRAVFGEVAGWERANWFARPDQDPVYEYSYGRQNWFAASRDEHVAVRSAVGLFDQSSFAKLLVQGRDSLAVLNRISAAEIDVPAGRVVYTQWLNERGGIEADLTVTRLAEHAFFIVTAAATQAHDFHHLEQATLETSCTATDVTSGYAVLGLMGPRARDLLAALTPDDVSAEKFKFRDLREIELGFCPRAREPHHLCRRTRLGAVLPTEFAPHAFDRIIDAGAAFGLKLCGYHALNSLRLEKSYRHWGHDIDSDASPLEAGLGFCVAWNKPGFHRARGPPAPARRRRAAPDRAIPARRPRAGAVPRRTDLARWRARRPRHLGDARPHARRAGGARLGRRRHSGHCRLHPHGPLRNRNSRHARPGRRFARAALRPRQRTHSRISGKHARAGQPAMPGCRLRRHHAPSPAMTAIDPLLQPFRLKHLTLRNRVMSTAHEPAYSEDGMPKQRYRLYHVEKAKGGAALTMTAGSAVVSRDSPPAFGNLLAWRDEIVPWLRELADECHGHGAAVMIQLTHLGRRTGWNKADWLPVLSASPVREPAHRAFPKEIEHWDIERIVADYAAAAQRMQAAGLDGLEIEAYGHLADSFWSPATNRRTDEYNGSLDNRMRFSLRVMQAMRAAVGADFLLGLRMVADEDWELGLSRADGVEIARRFKASGIVDFLNIIRGHIEHDNALVDVIPLTGMRSAPHLDFAGEVRAEVGIPVFHAARISDVATARHAIASGKLDMVGMTRALLADPHIVAKVARGDEQRIRPCVGVGAAARASRGARRRVGAGSRAAPSRARGASPSARSPGARSR